jgi:LysM repeat protein
MSQPDIPQARYGRERMCLHCGTRVAQKAHTCFFCGASLNDLPRPRARVPWADLFLFAVIGGVLALWWLRPPAIPAAQTLIQGDGQPSLLAQQQATTPAEDLLSDETQESSAEPIPATPPLVPTPTATLQPPATALAAPIRYTIKSGDTVVAIAQAYGSTMKDIIQANGLSADGRLRVGQELIVPVAGPMGGPGLGPTATPSGGTLIYTVQAGDTVSDIATRLKSQTAWILEANNMKPTDYLRIGQSLMVPLSSVTATPTIAVAVTPQTPTATPEPGLGAPALLAPPDGSILTGQDGVVLSWTAVGVLGADEWYVVTLRVGERMRTPVLWWTKGTTWHLPTEYRGSSLAGVDFNWQVQVRTGSASRPGAPTSPPSVERRFTWR